MLEKLTRGEIAISRSSSAFRMIGRLTLLLPQSDTFAALTLERSLLRANGLFMAVADRLNDSRSRKRMPVLQMLGDALLGEGHNVLASILVVRQSAFDELVDNGNLGLRREQVGIMRGRRSVCTAFLHRHTPFVAPHLPSFNASYSCGGVYELDRPDDGFDAILAQRDTIARPAATICNFLFKADAPHLMSPAIVQLDGCIG